MSLVSIVGGDSLLGRELRERISDELGSTAELIGGPSESILAEVEGEAAVLAPLDTDRLEDSNIVFCAGSPELTRRCYELASALSEPPAVIDLTYALEDLPHARLRSPLTETAAFTGAPDTIHVIAHPAAVALALVLSRVHSAQPVRHAVAQVFEPASERGQAGINELQGQVAGLLSFRPYEKRVFDAQIGFNLLPRYGSDAPESLESVEARIDRHLATLLAGAVPMPSLRLVQAPVFHGHSISLWVEFESQPSAEAIAEVLASAHIEVRSPELDPPSNAGAAGQSGVIAGVIEADRNQPRGLWLWVVADNFRVLADSAVAVAAPIFRSIGQ